MRILFVCSGNTCRSTMAEWLARKRFEGQADFESAGTDAEDGTYAGKEAEEVMQTLFGICIASHRSRNVKRVCINDFDYVVAMTKRLASQLESVYPSITAKLISWDIADPYGKDVAAYERCAREILKNVEELPVQRTLKRCR